MGLSGTHSICTTLYFLCFKIITFGVCVSPWNQTLAFILGLPLGPLTSCNLDAFVVLRTEPRTPHVLNILSSIQLHPMPFKENFMEI